jgi:hypothetical protein
LALGTESIAGIRHCLCLPFLLAQCGETVRLDSEKTQKINVKSHRPWALRKKGEGQTAIKTVNNGG